MKKSIKNLLLMFSRVLPDRFYLKLMYRFVTGKKLHLKNPLTYNEKLQWLKIYYRKKEFTDMVDKYAVRNYVSDRIGDNYLVPLLGVWDKPEEIDFDSLPNQFVLKCTHDCEGIFVCLNKKTINKKLVIKQMKEKLKRNFYYQGREWPYKNVVPRIIAEKYLHDDNETQLTDYKVFCFDGVPKLIQVDYDRFTGHKRQFFDTDWNRLDLSFHFQSDSAKVINKPSVLGEMLLLSRKLSSGFPHLRTDFYIVNNRLYVGEMTFFHGTGMGKWTPDSFDLEMGTWLVLPRINGKK